MELDRLIDACREAGAAALLLRGSEVMKKPDGTPVTRADLRANEILVGHLKGVDIPIISEELNDIPVHATGKAFIIDPIDGTSSFIEGDSGWAVMAALVEDGAPIAGVVYAPDLETLWFAEKDKGAFVERDGMRAKLSVSTVTDPHEATMLLSVHHASKRALAIVETLGTKQKSMSGLGVKGCTIAEGTADLYWTAGSLGEWDTCAPHIIVEEAGGIFTDARGHEIRYGSQALRPIAGVAVANFLLHSSLVAAGKTALGE